jgi:hypothetical protein
VAAHLRDRRAAAAGERVFRRPGIWTFSSLTRWPLPVARLESSQRKAFWASSLRALTGVQGMWSWLNGRRRRNSLGRCGDARCREGSPGAAPFERQGTSELVAASVAPPAGRRRESVEERKLHPNQSHVSEAIAAKNRVTPMASSGANRRRSSSNRRIPMMSTAVRKHPVDGAQRPNTP